MSVEALPPVVLALVAVVSGSIWQVAGTILLLHVVPRTVSDTWRVTLAWFLWLPTSGAVVLGLSLAHIAGRVPLLLGSATVIASAAISPNGRWLARAAREAWRALLAGAARWERWLLAGGLAVLGINLLFAAHPQRIYDQLNYHLVVGDLIVRNGDPFSGAWDACVLFTGVVEYGLAWHRAWFESRLLFHGLAQVAVFVATVPPLLLVGLALGRPTPGLFALLSLALPGVFPESVILRMSKPDGVVMTGVVVALAMLPVPGFATMALGLGALLVACKLTAVHAAIGLGAAALAARADLRNGRQWLPVLGIGSVALGLLLAKNALVLGNPVYPGASTLFPSWASDAWTDAYWKGVIFGGEPRWAGWLGPIRFAWPARVLVGMLTVTAGALAWTRRRGTTSPVQSGTVRGALAFLVAYAVAWPLFYGSRIYARFVDAFAGGMFVVLCSLLAGLAGRTRKTAEVLCVALAITICGVGWSVMNLVRWNVRTAEDAYAMQWPRLATARALQGQLEPSDTVVADAPEKFFFSARLLFEAPLSPRERGALDDLRRDPVVAAARYRVKAVVVAADKPMSPLLQAIWNGLSAHGEVKTIGPDRVLISACHFQPGC